ncbi:hypothetical protein [Kutzneria sp. 744]|uniref:hypothetical protein n=1 Tax=Kutzneria sp. (strain 744) TaxID=345341 RepID=UPI0012F8CCA5|nr:hypothetical protein [Kutzneria sp. 744]
MATMEAKGARSPDRGRETGASGQEVEKHVHEGGQRTGTLSLPFATVHWRLPEFRVPGRQEMDAAVHAVRSVLPPPSQLAYYTGLGVLAVFEVVEWPVVAVAAAGMIVAQRAFRSQDEHGEKPDAKASGKSAE